MKCGILHKWIKFYTSAASAASDKYHVWSSHHSDQMSQRSQVSRIAPLGCSLMEVHR